MTMIAPFPPGVDATHHLRLAVKVASRYKRIGELAGFEWDDLVQEAHIGLLQAARNFDPDRCLEFSTLAYRMIRYRLLRVMRTPLRRVDKLKVESLPIDDRLTDDQASASRERELDRAALAKLLSRLNPADLEMIRTRFGVDGYAPSSVADLATLHQVSRQRIYQRIQHGLNELQRLACEYGMTD